MAGLAALRWRYARRRLKLLRVAPCHLDIFEGDRRREAFLRSGFAARPARGPDRTLVIDLRPGLDRLRANFDGKWRRDLVKAEKSPLRVTRSENLADFDLLSALLEDLEKEKGFSTEQGAAVFRGVVAAGGGAGLVTHLARLRDEVVGGHVGGYLGATATYILRAANAVGREHRASYLLQWAAMETAIESGATHCDLGGIDEDANPDVFRFKTLMGGARRGLRSGAAALPVRRGGADRAPPPPRQNAKGRGFRPGLRRPSVRSQLTRGWRP